MANYPDQITAKDAAQKGANASGVFVYYWKTPTGRWEVSIVSPPSSVANFGRCKAVAGAMSAPLVRAALNEEPDDEGDGTHPNQMGPWL